MLELFVPDLFIENYKVLSIDALQNAGIKLLVIDIDNTLVPFDVEKPDWEAMDFLMRLKASKVTPVIVSNNHEPRVRKFLEDTGIAYYYESRKPLKTTYMKVVKDFRVKAEEVATIGDQLMTDVFGANRCGFYTILTRPLVRRDIFSTKINRILERGMFYILKKKGLFDRDSYEM